MTDKSELETLRNICRETVKTLSVIDDWLGMASTRQAADDSIWRLSRILKQAGFDYEWRNILDWRGAMVKELNDAGFFVGEDGKFHYDPMADKDKPYRVYGNAIGPTIKEIVEMANRDDQTR